MKQAAAGTSVSVIAFFVLCRYWSHLMWLSVACVYRSYRIAERRACNKLMVAILLCTTVACSDQSTISGTTIPVGISLHTELGGSAEGFARACDVREFSFPADHGAHSSYRNEWWYVTGNLESEASIKFGFHATFFRIANKPPSVQGATGDKAISAATDESVSNWSADQFYMGHFAITEEGDNRIRAHERFARAAAGLAGAQTNPVRIWLDDWRLVAGVDDGDKLVWQLTLKEGDESIDLILRASKPIVLQGRAGLSQKSRQRCNASYYYSIPRMQASGSVMANGVSHDVSGTAWFDREWSSSALAEDHVGWDWFSLQLADGRDLMVYQLRTRDGGIDPHSYAVEMKEDGSKRIIDMDAVDITVDQWWRSETGAVYPIGGRIYLADTDETILYRPLIEDQELQLTVRYWEGAITLSDASGDSVGYGYLELTGY